MRAFPVRLPSGARYWTVLDEDLAVVPVADGFLRQGGGGPRGWAARGEDGQMGWRMRARHRRHEPETPVDRASDEEIVGLLRACLSARDRLIVLLMARAGLRRGELCGLRRSDVHLLADSRPLGCEVTRAHLHVIRREDNPNGAWAKSRRQRTVPLDFLAVQAFDTYELERMRVPPSGQERFPAGQLVPGAGRRAAAARRGR